jgi:predicted nucleic acid-binding protein
MNIIVDASSLASLFLPDEDSSTVERYLEQAETVAAPKLAIVETAAAFFRRARKGSLTVLQATAAAASWMRQCNREASTSMRTQMSSQKPAPPPVA